MVDSIRSEATRLFAEMVADIRNNSRAAGQVATGKTLASMEVRQGTTDNGGLRLELWARAYFGALDTGSRPARRKGSEAEREQFIRQLTEWCKLRGVPSAGLGDERYRSFAKFLKWHINKYGTALYRNPSKQYKVIKPATDRFEQRLTYALRAWFDKTVANEFYTRK